MLDVVQEITGISAEQLIRDVYDGKIKPPKSARYGNLDPAVAERMEALEQEVNTAKTERAQAAAREAYTRDVGIVTDFFKENAEDFPLLNALPWAPGTLVNMAGRNAGKTPNEIAVDMEQRERANLASLLSNDAALDAVLKSNDKLKERLAARFTTGGQVPAVSNGRGAEAGNGASSLGSASSESALAGADTRTREEIDEFAHRQMEHRWAEKRAGRIS
jgi:hypothetical protein